MDLQKGTGTMFVKEVATDMHEFYYNVYISPVQSMPGFYRIVSQDKQQAHIINGRRITVIYPEVPEAGYFDTTERR